MAGLIKFRFSSRTVKILGTISVIAVILLANIQVWNIQSVGHQPGPKYYILDNLYVEPQGTEILGWDACQVPDISPQDPRVGEYLYNFPRLPCMAEQPQLVSLLDGGTLVFNENEIEAQQLRSEDLRCVYREVVRTPGSDDSVSYEKKETQFSDKVLLNSDVDIVYVRCETTGLFGRVRYENLLPVFRKRANTEKREGHKKPSVLFLGIDSLSRLNSLRLLPSMHRFLRKQLKAHVFSLHVKCGLNTRPNMAAMLTGKRIYNWDVGGVKLKAELSSIKPNTSESMFIDDWPIIWKEFQQKGYTTMFGEDLFDIATFNYLEKGFKNPPTHHYLRPYFLTWNTLNKDGIIHNKHVKYCVMNKPVYDVLLDWSTYVYSMYRDSPAFGYTFVGYTHDYLSQFQQLDAPMTRTLESLFYGHLLENTILFVIGDHGLRMSDFRNTWMGRLEDNMPLFSVVLPEWMREQYPHLEDSLSFNTGKLTTWYDVYATLQDILNENFEFSSEYHDRGGKGLSLFKKIAVNRTCEEAGIPLSYCPCMMEKELKKSDKIARDAAQEVVNEINRMLKDTDGKCATLTVQEIKEAASLQMEVDHVSKGEKVSVGIRIVVVTAPSNGLFETVLTFDPQHETYIVKETIQRINKYGKQGACVHDLALERLCYCL